MASCSRQHQDRVRWCAFSLATVNLQCSNTREILKAVIIFFIQLLMYALVIYEVEMKEKL